MVKKCIVLAAVVLLVCTTFTGCIGMGGPQPTPPPEKEYKTAAELSAAVASAKADANAADEAGLRNLTSYYILKSVPAGAEISYIKVSTGAVRVGYSFGSDVADSYDNKMEIAWYRTVSTSDFISKMQQSMPQADVMQGSGISYLHITPDVQIAVTPSPGVTPSAAPTPKTTKFCQFVYWVQDNAAFVAALPLGFTKDDVAKYCSASAVELK